MFHPRSALHESHIVETVDGICKNINRVEAQAEGKSMVEVYKAARDMEAKNRDQYLALAEVCVPDEAWLTDTCLPWDGTVPLGIPCGAPPLLPPGNGIQANNKAYTRLWRGSLVGVGVGVFMSRRRIVQLYDRRFCGVLFIFCPWPFASQMRISLCSSCGFRASVYTRRPSEKSFIEQQCAPRADRGFGAWAPEGRCVCSLSERDRSGYP